ncbi:hypothetical protein Gotri_000040, partial [Gossypium trilobum]|nr:hypothetical protein [Gossypium trilobum]
LYHLETLILKNRSKLKNLPSKVRNLVSLHFLDIRGADSIERMPSGFDQLTKLQTLSNFIMGKGDGHLIRELKILSNLRGGFCPSGLDNVNGRDAREFKLNDKLGINGLELHWSTNLENYSRKKEVEELKSMCWTLFVLRKSLSNSLLRMTVVQNSRLGWMILPSRICCL